MILALLVGVAAAAGAACRYLLDQIVQHQRDSSLPIGTFVINTTGCLLLGLLTGLASKYGLPSAPVTVAGVGFLGGYTTWSTFTWESLALAEGGELAQAAGNIVLSLAAGLAAAAAGLGLVLL